MIEWLSRIEGIKIDSIVENRSSNQFQFEESSGIVITKIKPRVVVPNNLELLEYDPMSPPRRDFRVVD